MPSFPEEFAHLRIPLEDILQATYNFAAQCFIARGGFGSVYKGDLLRPEGLVTVAFKRLDRESEQGSHEFLCDISVLSSYKHENIVSLVGFCDEGDEMIVVYKFVTHGSLDQYVSSAHLTWLQRLQICLGAARGLTYLHYPPTETQIRVIHGDLKSANILLDENWQPKIADFGLSKFHLVSEQSDFLVTNAAGTFGYLDPVYYNTGVLTKESDLYSFGVVLFEILCGVLAYEEGKGFLGPLACRHYCDGKLTEIIDPILRKQMSADSLDFYSAIAYQCLEND